MEIRLVGITQKYGNKAVIKPLDITIKDGSFTTLLGPSGCGKTTLLRIISGLETPDSGDIFFDDKLIFSSEKGINIPPEKRGLGFVFQDFALWPHMSVYENVAFGLRTKGKTSELDKKVRAALRAVKLDDLAERYDEYCQALAERTLQLLDKYNVLIFPVPKYGRGEEIISLFAKNNINAEYYGDGHFIEQVSHNNIFWKKACKDTPHISHAFRSGKGIYFISSPQLNDPQVAELTKQLISCGGYAVMTGTVETGSLSEQLIKTGRGEFIRYPVHQGINEYNTLCKNNNFRFVTAYHTKDIIV